MTHAKRIFLSMAMLGACAITVPGLTIGWVVPVAGPLMAVLPLLIFVAVAWAARQLAEGRTTSSAEVDAVRAAAAAAAGGKRRKTAWMLGVTGFLAGAAVGGVAWDLAGRAAMASAVASLKEAGVSLDVPKNAPAIPDKDNAATILLKAGEAAVPVTKGGKPAPDFFGKKTEVQFTADVLAALATGREKPEEVAAARKLVASRREAIALFDQGAGCMGASWGIDWTLPQPTFHIPVYSGLVQAARLSAIRGFLAARDGDAGRAAAAVRTGLLAARAVGSEPVLIAQMVSVAMTNLALRPAVPAVNRVPPEALRKLWGSALEPGRIHHDYLRSMDAECLWMAHVRGISDLLRMQLGSDGRLSPGRLGFEVIYGPFLRLDLASILRWEARMLAAIREPYRKGRTQLEALEQEQGRGLWLLARIAAPSFYTISGKVLIAVVNEDLALASIAAREYKLKKNRWPERIADLETDPGKPLLDRFSGGRLRIMPYGGGIIIYSVGPDGVDDQGAPYDNSAMTGDLAWALK